MPRKPRIEYPGAVYHVMSRGNRQEAIYRDDRDCEVFLDTLGEACAKTGWRIHAFVLMGNHYHLLLESPEANLVAGMKWLQGTYTQRFNARHGLCGHLLQGRYKAVVVESASHGYFSIVGNYIHLNPARAGLLDSVSGKLADYRWSSFPFYLYPSKRPDWLAVDRVLGALGVQDDRKGQSWYRQYMNKRVSEVISAAKPADADEEWEVIRKGWYLGSPEFRDELLDRLDDVLKGVKRKSLDGEEMRSHDEVEARRLLRKALEVLGIRESDLPDMQKGAPEKAVLAWYLRKNTTVGRAWIAERLIMGDESRITKLVRAVENDQRCRELIRRITDS
jgi:REP element-mobilizing transposase RayT